MSPEYCEAERFDFDWHEVIFEGGADEPGIAPGVPSSAFPKAMNAGQATSLNTGESSMPAATVDFGY